jgi:cyclophilin family peptidyl-prolyl cis-trans isomerase
VCSPLALRAQSTVPALSQTLSDRTFVQGGAAQTVDLRNNFNVPGVTGTVVQFDTDLGRFNVEMLASDAPVSVANFLSYVNDGSYNGTIIHRSTALSGTGNGIVQGGGYTYSLPVTTTTRKAPIVLEYKLANVRGTLAFARTTDVNSATSEWFFNTDDNTAVLGQSNGGGYAVFARVLGTGMSVVDAIYALPTYNAGGAFTNLPLRNYNTSNSVVLANLIDVASTAVIPLYPPPTGSATAVLTFSATSTNVGAATVALSGSTLTVTPVGTGTATITVRAVDVNGNAATGTFAVNVQALPPPAITAQPLGHTVAAGSTVVLSVGATGTGLTYQWKKGGNAIAGATATRLVIGGAQAADAGSYTVTVTNGAGTAVTSSAAVVSVVTTSDPGRIFNLSIRGTSGTGNKVLIMGFVTGGDGTSGNTSLLIRGVGPSIIPAPYYVTDALTDPEIQVIPAGSATALASNDDWGGTAQLKAAATGTGAFALIADGSKDAALVADFPRNLYSVIVSGKAGATGSVLAEIYDANLSGAFSAATPRLVNISARAFVSATDNLIAGFVIVGQTAKTVLIRGIGPDPTFAANVGNANLGDPRLAVFHAHDGTSDLILTNDDWGGEAQLTAAGTAVGAAALTNAASKDSVVLATLDPGVYSAQVSGAPGTSGITLVEVYELP